MIRGYDWRYKWILKNLALWRNSSKKSIIVWRGTGALGWKYLLIVGRRRRLPCWEAFPPVLFLKDPSFISLYSIHHIILILEHFCDMRKVLPVLSNHLGLRIITRQFELLSMSCAFPTSWTKHIRRSVQTLLSTSIFMHMSLIKIALSQYLLEGLLISIYITWWRHTSSALQESGF